MRSCPQALIPIVLLAAAPAWAIVGDEAWKAYGAGEFAKAKALCQSPADAGDASCQTLIGNLHLKGQTVAVDYTLAEKYFRKSSDQGISGGQQALGWLYENGFGVKKDLSQAARLYRLSADQGDRWGQTRLGWLYVYGRGVAQDYAKALKYFKKSAEQGHGDGQNAVGYIYYSGWGVKQDYAQAALWWRKAAEQGVGDSQQGLAWLYQNGWGVKQDPGEAFKWFKKSSDQGNQWGQNGLANLYLSGIGVKQDDAEAARLFLASAEQGNAYAANGIGYCLRSGRGLPRDYARALEWFRTAVARGELSHAPTNLGILYENGNGVTQDFVEAYKWYLIGAAHDNPQAPPGVERLRALMTKEQIAEAQRLAAATEGSGHPRAPAPAAVPSASPLASAVDTPGFRRPERPDDLALVVGVESYSLKDLPPASFAERDADAVAANLAALGVPPRNLRVLKGSEATAGKLRGYLESWLPKNAKPGSRVYFYFSGHGAPNPQNGDAYLLPWDGDPSLLKETAQSLKDVYASLGELKAAEVVVALDACFSGAGGRSVIQKGTRPLVTVAAAPSLPARLSVLAAAEGDQTTGTLDAEGHGLFTYYLLEGLSRGHKTSTALCEYLKPKVADAAARENRTQTPSCRGTDAAF